MSGGNALTRRSKCALLILTGASAFAREVLLRLQSAFADLTFRFAPEPRLRAPAQSDQRSAAGPRPASCRRRRRQLAACSSWFFFIGGKEQSFARVFGGRKGDVRRQRAYRRKQKFASLIFDSGKRFCSVGTVAVAVGIRRPYISLRSGAAPARPCAKRPAFRRWTTSGKLPVAMPLKRLPF